MKSTNRDNILSHLQTEYGRRGHSSDAALFAEVELSVDLPVLIVSNLVARGPFDASSLLPRSRMRWQRFLTRRFAWRYDTQPRVDITKGLKNYLQLEADFAIRPESSSLMPPIR